MATVASATELSAAEQPYLGIRNLSLTVRDIDAMIAWYGAVLPLGEVRRETVSAGEFGPELLTRPDGEVEIALLSVPTGFLQLMRFSEGLEPPTEALPVIGPGYTHMCLQSPQSQAALPVMLRQGLRLVSRCDEQGVDIGGYGVRYAYGRDREGRMLEVEHLDRPQRGERGWVTHLANVVHDLDAMLAFYTALTGSEPYRTIEQAGRPTLDDVAGIDDIAIRGGWFRVSNMEIEVWQYNRPRTPAPIGRRRLDEVGYNAIAFECADLDREMARLNKLGIEITGPEIMLGGWRTRYAADPEGNLFAVQQRVTAPPRQSVAGLSLYDRAAG